MSYLHKIGLFGPPGSGKTLAGLSYKGCEHQVFGSSEETTALGFKDRSHLLPLLKLDWFNFLSDSEKKKITAEPPEGKELEYEAGLGLSKERANARLIISYRRHIAKLKERMMSGDKTAPKAVFLDNGTPFADIFGDYILHVFASEFETKMGNFDSIRYSMKYGKELIEFFRDFYALPCHVIVSFHVTMTVDEETAARVDFLKDSKAGIKHKKEWQPFLTGKAKYNIASIPDYSFLMCTEEQVGLPTKYYAKLAGQDIGKARVNPFEKPNRIVIPKGTFYQFLEDALEKKQ